MAEKTIRYRLLPGLLLGFTVFLGILLLGDLSKVGQMMISFDWRVYPLVLGLTLFNYGLRFLKWHYYLHQIGVANPGWWQSLRLFVAGFPLAMTPAKSGEALKGVWLNRMSGLPVARGVSVVVAERISDGLAVLGLASLGVIAYPRYWPAFAAILAVLLAVVLISQMRPAALWGLGLIDKVTHSGKVAAQLRQFYEGSFTLFRPRSTLMGVSLGIISWLGEGVGFYWILLGLGLEAELGLLATAVFVLAFSTLVGGVSTLPGGLGAAEASIAGMLTLLLGADPATAAAATLLIRLATLWFGVGLGLLAWSVSPDLMGIHRGHEHILEG